jgi:hypothetical protein
MGQDGPLGMERKMDVQVIKDEKGRPAYAVVPWSKYEKLLARGDEDAALIAAGDAARGDDVFPAEIAARLVAGEVPLKVIREWRGLTQEELTLRSGVNSKYISQIERRADGRALGRRTAAKLAIPLNVKPDSLLE